MTIHRPAEERAREVLARVNQMPPTTSRTIFYAEETVIAALTLHAEECEAKERERCVKAAEAIGSGGLLNTNQFKAGWNFAKERTAAAIRSLPKDEQSAGEGE